MADSFAAAPTGDLELRELVERIQLGDTDADARLYARFGPRVAYLAWRELRSSDHVDDVKSETMMRALEAIRDRRLRSADALPSFILQIARNVIREVWRKNRRFVSIDETDESVEPSAPPVEAADPAAARALQLAMNRLGARDRAFLRMSYYDDLPREEIARRLGVADDRVRLIRSRALQRFRDAYGEVTRR